MIGSDHLGTGRDSLRVTLSLFEGPMDLLLHLIQEQKIEISDIPIATITTQYLEALDLMRDLDLTVAGEYLVMASTLILIKSRMLLPIDPDDVNGDEEDPRLLLSRQLQEYRVYRDAGSYLQNCHEMQSLLFLHPAPEEGDPDREWILDATVLDLLRALRDVLSRQTEEDVHVVIPNSISIREKMADLLTYLNTHGPTLFQHYFASCANRQEVIVSFLALLELVKVQLVLIRQRRLWADILIAPIRTENVIAVESPDGS